MRLKLFLGFSLLASSVLGCASPGQPFNQRGVAYFNQGRFDAAMREFHQAAARDPLNADAYYNIASIHHSDGRLGEADWNYSHCLALDPEHAKCNHARVVLLLEQGKRDEAYASIQRWRQLAPASPEPIVELAWLEKQLGRNEDSFNLLQNALEIEPRHPRALTELASHYEASNQTDRALALYQRALSYDPTQPELVAKVADLRGPSRDQNSSAIGTAPNSQHGTRDFRYGYR